MQRDDLPQLLMHLSRPPIQQLARRSSPGTRRDTWRPSSQTLAPRPLPQKATATADARSCSATVSASAAPESTPASGTTCDIKDPHPSPRTRARTPDPPDRTAHASPAAATPLWFDTRASSIPDAHAPTPLPWPSPPSPDPLVRQASRTTTRTARPSSSAPANRRPQTTRRMYSAHGIHRNSASPRPPAHRSCFESP